MNAIVTIASLTIGHVLYQLLQSVPNWDVATERIFFQAGAIAVYVIGTKIDECNKIS